MDDAAPAYADREDAPPPRYYDIRNRSRYEDRGYDAPQAYGPPPPRYRWYPRGYDNW